MFDISALKEMKLSELQEIAKLAKTIKFNGVKKEDLIAQILEQQAKSSDSVDSSKEVSAEKPKRARITASKKETVASASERIVDVEVIPIGVEVIGVEVTCNSLSFRTEAMSSGLMDESLIRLSSCLHICLTCGSESFNKRILTP